MLMAAEGGWNPFKICTLRSDRIYKTGRVFDAENMLVWFFPGYNHALLGLNLLVVAKHTLF